MLLDLFMKTSLVYLDLICLIQIPNKVPIRTMIYGLD